MRSETALHVRALWVLSCALFAACSDGTAPANTPTPDVPPADVSADLASDTAQDDSPQVVPHDASNDLPLDAAKDTSLDLTEDVALDIANDITDGSPDDAAKDAATTEDIAEDAATDTIGDVAEDIAKDVSGDTLVDVPVDTGLDAMTCTTGLTACGGACVDTERDGRHCGACGQACVDGFACRAGACVIVCPGVQVACGDECVSTASNPHHCGACGNECPTGARCTAGSCVCPSGQAVCAGACTDTSVSRSHCGACGRACVAEGGTAACVDGACIVAACEAGRGDCDRRADNGCEAVLGSDPANCGACGNVCATGMCTAGACVGARTCAELHMISPSAPSGAYPIDPDGPGGEPSFMAWCDMSTDGGGWTYLATVTNNGDAPDMGNWLVTTPTPNNWESTTTFGTLDPTLNQDYRSAAFHRVAGRALMVTHRNRFLLRTDDACLGNVTLRDRFTRLAWTCGGSQDFTSVPTCTNACVIARATPQSGDTALLNGIARTRLFFKAGEADGAQDTNRDRTYLSTDYRSNVDAPVGLGAFCSGIYCTPRVGEADVNNYSDAITPTAGTEFYGLWIR